jgi:uncharacterized protein YggL (DUF469 family)
MKDKLLFGLIILLTSCSVDHTAFSGEWIDKKNEQEILLIQKNGNNYIVEINDKKYPAKIKDDLLEISTELPINAIIDNNDILIVGGKEYVRFEKTKIYQFKGKWKAAYHVENGKQVAFSDLSDFWYIIIGLGPTIDCEFEIRGEIMNCQQALGHRFQQLSFENNAIVEKIDNRPNNFMEFTINSDGYLMMKSPTDTKYTLFKKE